MRGARSHRLIGGRGESEGPPHQLGFINSALRPAPTTLLLSTRSDATEDTLSLTHSTLALSRRQEEKETASMGDETEYIKLKVVGQDSNEIHFRVKQTTQMVS